MADTTARAILLTVAFQERKEIAGRTLFQKVIYFENVMLDLGIDFVPYYYGPYSREVTEEIEGLVATGLMEEEVIRRYPPLDFGGTQESRMYVYRLTEKGQNVVRFWEKQDPHFAGQIKSVIEQMRASSGLPSGKALSIAAKMYHILRLADKRVTVEEIRNEAQAIGWEITTGEAEQAVDFLATLGLVRVESSADS